MTTPITHGSGRFDNVSFAPDPRRASTASMVRAQTAIESKLFLRHGEQQLLSLVIPFVSLVTLTVFDVVEMGLDVVFPLTLAISAMSSGFTGQAIAVAFDRRYGALKRIGASGVPPWTIIAGKVAAVLAVAAVQTLILGVTAVVLGWRAAPVDVALAAVVLILGVAAFCALGLLLGGTLGSEFVLAFGNLLWFLFVGIASYATIRLGATPPLWLELIPSVALAEGLESAFAGHVPVAECVIIGAWALVGSVTATRLFKFT